MRILSMTKRIIKQILGDKRTLALLLIAPVFAIYLLNVIFNSAVTKPNLTVVNIPAALIDSLKSEAHVNETDNADIAYDLLKNKKIDALLTFSDNKLTVTVEGSETSITAAVSKSVSKAVANYSKALVSSNPQLAMLGIKMMDSQFIFINGSENMNSFDSIAPMIMGFFIFFFVFLLAGVSFLRERLSGTLERLMATPIRRMEIAFGYFFGFGAFVALQTIVIQLFMTYALGITIKGNPFLVLLINLLLAAGSLSLGTLLSAFAKNEFQLFQFIPVVIIPQILFSGLFPLREAPVWVVFLSRIFPLTYGADALNSVVLRGSSFSDVSFDILIIAGYAVLFVVLNAFALKKYRRV
jgi:ABC-2 type transport system permease protein